MKYKTLILSFLALFLFCSFANYSKVYVAKLGTITYYGNEPFSFPGLVTENNEEFTLLVAEINEEQTIPEGYTAITNSATFKEINGNKIEFLGNVSKKEGKFQKLKDGYFKVFAYKIVK